MRVEFGQDDPSKVTFFAECVGDKVLLTRLWDLLILGSATFDHPELNSDDENKKVATLTAHLQSRRL